MPSVVEVNDPAELESYRLAWAALFPGTRGASFFHTLDWLLTYWQHYGAGQRLRVLVVTGERGPIGILPLVVRTERYKVGRMRVLTYPLHDWGTYYGPIGPNPTATLLAGLRHIRQTGRDWDLMDVRWTDTDGWEKGRTARAMRQVGLRPSKAVWMQTATIDLKESWEQYQAARSSKWRNNRRRDYHRVESGGPIELVRYRPGGASRGDDDPRWDLYEMCEELARRSWQGRSTTGTTLSHAEVRPFFREAHALAARLGMLDLNLLFVGGRPSAFAYNYCHQGRIYGLRAGFDAECCSTGSGRVLYAKMIEDSFARGDRLFDLGVGSLEGKRYFRTGLQTIYRYTHFPGDSVRAQLLWLKRVAGRWWSAARDASRKSRPSPGPSAAG